MALKCLNLANSVFCSFTREASNDVPFKTSNSKWNLYWTLRRKD